MGDTSVTKVNSQFSPQGAMGQKYLASGVHVAMRLWEEEPPGASKAPSRRDDETVGYVINGRAELHLEGQKVVLEPGDSWVVSKGAVHTYSILESFTAVEATYPPAHVHGRDERWVRPSHQGVERHVQREERELLPLTRHISLSLRDTQAYA
jgi:quercetin dioxygenase-like cupin family protein